MLKGITGFVAGLVLAAVFAIVGFFTRAERTAVRLTAAAVAIALTTVGVYGAVFFVEAMPTPAWFSAIVAWFVLMPLPTLAAASVIRASARRARAERRERRSGAGMLASPGRV